MSRQRPQHRAADLGLPAGARVLSARAWTTPQDWIDTLLAPLSVGGSTVLVANADQALLGTRVQQERVTNTV